MIILITVKLHYGAKTVIGFLVFDYKSKYGEYCQQLSQYFDKKLIQIKCDFGENSGQQFEGLEGVYEAIKVCMNTVLLFCCYWTYNLYGMLIEKTLINFVLQQYLHNGLNIGKVIVKL